MAMKHALFGLAALLVLWFDRVCAYRAFSARRGLQSRFDGVKLHNVFKNIFGGSGKEPAQPSAANANVKVLNKYDSKNVPLEKISNTQKRDYEAEFASRVKPEKIIDKQVTSFNFGKSDQFPNLFKGWLKKEGSDQIAKQIITAMKAAIQKQERYIELLFDPVPNLDEVAFGTIWNQKFRFQVAENLKVPEFATNRGGPSTLEWSNLYWANRIAEGLGYKNIIAVTISGEGTKGKYPPTFHPSIKLYSLADAKRLTAAEAGSVNAVIILSPCQESHYKDAKAIADKLNAPAVALNSPYSYRYDIGGGAPYTLAYVMKRIPKGWIYRVYPREFEAIIEGPNYEVFRAGTFKTQPALTEISKLSTDASAQKYGKVGNDRIFQQRL